MPVIEYCTFLAALCLNCGAVGPAALKVTAQQGCHGECLEPETLWEEHFLLPQVCFECEPVGFGRSVVLCLEEESGLAHSHVRLTPLPCCSRCSCACPEVTCLSTSSSPVPSTVGYRTILVLERFQHLSELIMLSVSFLLCCWTGTIHAYSVVFPL